MIVEFNSLFEKDGYSLKQSSKYLLMAAANIVQQLTDQNGAIQLLAMESKKPDYDDFCSLLGCELESLQKALQLIADQEETDISEAYFAGSGRPVETQIDPVDRNCAPAGRLVT